MSGRLVQIIGIIIGVIGAILSLVFGIIVITDGNSSVGLGTLLGGFFGSISVALIIFAIGTTLVKVTHIEEMMENENPENLPVLEKEEKKEQSEQNKNYSHAIDKKAEERYKQINQEPTNDDYVDVICPSCKKRLSIEKWLYESGDSFPCPYCDQPIKSKK